MSWFGRGKKNREVEATYYNNANGWWHSSVMRIFISQTYTVSDRNGIREVVVPSNKAGEIRAGIARWKAFCDNELVHLKVEYVEDAAQADVVINFSPSKPGGKWAMTDLIYAPVSYDPNNKHIVRATVTFHLGLNSDDQRKSSAHEFGHFGGGIKGHAPAGLMHSEIQSDRPNSWDFETGWIGYRQRREYKYEPPVV